MSKQLKNMRTALLCLLVTVISLSISAQNVTVKGTVTDKTGETVIGASVVEKGNTGNGTITDIDGNYTLSVSSNATLVFSYVGMKTQEVKINGKKIINLVMEDDSQALEEVVVIGYGTVQKKDLTGAVSSVSAKDISAIPVSSATEAMTGKLAGVNITTTEGSPDADVKIRVRGGGSLSQDNSPLYIVDGFPVSSISDIAPSEIQSIDVLKDASSTAIYGARGANGVVIITTKEGREGKTQIDFGASFGIRKVNKLEKVLNPYEFAYYQYELGSTEYGSFDDLEIWKSIEGTDFQDELFGRTGNQTQYNINVSGGGKDVKYNISFAHSDEKSIMLGSGFSKNNINAKVKVNLSEWMTLDFNARLSDTQVDGLSGGADNESNASNSLVAQAARFRPITPLNENTDDEEASSNRKKNPLERVNATFKQRNTLNQNYNAGLNWKPFKNITLRSEFGYSWKSNDTDQFWGADATQSSSLFGGNGIGLPQAQLTMEDTETWRNSNTITYDNNKLFNGRDRINVLLGQEMSSSQTNTRINSSYNFPLSMSIDEIKANMSAGTPWPNSTKIGAKDNLLSFFGRINYTMMDKYLFTFTMRADGSSKFADGNRWGIFPSAAVAWRISDEAFMQGSSDWLSNLKLRLSYGTAGNNRISSGLMYTTYEVPTGSGIKYPYFNETLNTLMSTKKNLSNPNLKWETTITRDLGIDFGFWNNRISGSLDFYWNSTKDLLMSTVIPSNTGYEYQYQNFGETSNKGIELALNTVLLDTKKASLNFTFNISWNKSKIEELALDNPWQSSKMGLHNAQDDFRVEAGGRLGEIWGYKTNGIYTPYDAQANPNGELILNKSNKWVLREGLKDNSYTLTGSELYPGQMKFEVDENGNPIKQRLGNTIAPVTGGFGINGTVGNFDFNVFCNYSVGNKLINASKLGLSFYHNTSKGYNLSNDLALSNRYLWVDPATGMNLGKIANTATLEHYGSAEAIAQRLIEMNAGRNSFSPSSMTKMYLNDYAVEDASFLRLQNVTIGYTLPKAWVKKVFMQNVRVYVTGYNLLCLTNYSGLDPEVDCSGRKNAMTPGVDYAAYPKSRSFVAGINVSF